MELWKKSIQHFKVELRGEFEIKSEDTDFTQDFEIESDHVGTALTELGKQINIAMLGQAKDILKELFPKIDEKKHDVLWRKMIFDSKTEKKEVNDRLERFKLGMTEKEYEKYKKGRKGSGGEKS